MNGRTKTETFLGFAKSEELKPYSDDEKFLKEMQRETSALDGCWNLHRVTMKDSTAMDTTTIAKIMEMKERGAKYLNFQFLIGPGGSGSVEFQSENWTLGFEVERFAGVQESDVSASNTDEINFNLFNHWDSSENACDFEMFIINSDNEIVENALIYGNVYLDRINSANQEKMEDISYRVVINVFPEIEME
ncbi:unnamed protein product [Oikopleura dioica]|uniref:Uncharacterized protein n=2 Tax=Oikopleura dioica TaxID=34765 RepID=E4XD58_OIKDI|nr:unnamed protein product [Oikopleura dioica]